MRAILIDPHTRTIEHIELAPGIDALYTVIGADCFCTVNLDEPGDAVFLDDGGLFREGQEFFALGNYPNPLAGRGVILGCDDEGESRAALTDIETVRNAVHWLTPAEAVTMNREAALAMETHAAIENAKGGTTFHVIHAPLLELDEATGKARAAA